jgi:hypothetical protein
MRVLAFTLAVFALQLLGLGLAQSNGAGQPFSASVAPLPASLQAQLVAGGDWHAGCPVPLSRLRLLSVSVLGFDGIPYRGQLVVNAGVAPKLAIVFRALYAAHFPVRDLTLAANYGTRRERRAPDVSGAFECRQAVPSPCVGGSGTGSWSMHAYGEAVDLNPDENPYVGCGMNRNKKALSYMNRSRVRPGMVTPAIVRAFAAVGWGWGGSWIGSTKDYMHFSSSGH